MFYDYCESGSWTEQTFRDNISDFSKLRLRQRVAVDMANRTTATKMIGQDVSMPVALAPVGLTGMQCADGEIKAAKAAAAFGVPFTLSTMSICSIEDVAAATDAPFWFQLYTLTDEDYTDRLDPKGERRQLLGLGDHPGPSTFGPAPQRHQKRPLRPAQADPENHRKLWQPNGVGALKCSAPSAAALEISWAMWMGSLTTPR